ncbi:MAG: NAD(P)H-dependent glycerol-3-phosphate dehydrogenase [Deltaproteobacteria bacterium]|nr:MAG: NAD(P)H-dependent glycerol-3-phosphate dehydrogenase [Deltaproteobacteria bacterium]
MNVAILGSGNWGRALATLAAEAGHRARLGHRGRPPGGFPGSPNFHALTAESDLTLVAVPPSAVREVIRLARPGPAARVVIACRGLEPETGGWLSEVVTAESACLRVGAITGPTIAAEVMARRPSAMVVASEFDEVADRTQRALHSAICRVYTSSDLRGVELSGAAVTVLSVAVGVADGLKLGVGVRAIIVSRGIAETVRLGRKLGANPDTFRGLAGVGDLIAAASLHDHPGTAAGLRMAQGGTADADTRKRAEAMVALARRHDVELPLAEAVAAIAAGRLKPRLAIDMLMRREATTES